MLYQGMSQDVRCELHNSPKSAAANKARWEMLGYKVKMYFVNNSDDTLVGLEVSY